jgi:SAM-dependent methyltransferase
LPAATFDCFILTQTLHIIYETNKVLASAHHVLRPGGRLLVTAPVVSRVSRSVGVDGDYWRFTSASLGRLLAESFGREAVSVRSYGNVLAGIAFLAGLAAEELPPRRLERHDEFFPVVVAGRAVKGAT